jgi:hypothetical protein
MKPEQIIRNKLSNISRFYSIFVNEFTYNAKRIDAIIIDIQHRWIRGFEIKTNRNDFLQDKKWTGYSEFLSSLSIVCPPELIKPEEIERPFGLLWVDELNFKWKKRPINFQSRKSLAWFWTYLHVVETEFLRFNQAKRFGE